jgi:DNA-directed RNA polymerase subunit RPC12/RpoP
LGFVPHGSGCPHCGHRVSGMMPAE